MKVFIFLFLITFASTAFSQERPFSRDINLSTANITAPSLSGDKKVLLYLSDYVDSYEPTLFISTLDGRWTEGVRLPKDATISRFNYKYGHFLDFTGKTVYYTTKRGGGNGYDIWSMERTETGWGRPEPLRAPINTTGNDASPSLTPDNLEMYFIRCDKMDAYESSGCKIYYSSYNGTAWEEPIALPANINTGNVTAPRILADKVTLVFAAIKPGNKGGYDLYMSRKSANGVWGDPVPMDFVNTENDEVMISTDFNGILLTLGKMGNSKEQLVDAVVPADFRVLPTYLFDFDLVRDFPSQKIKLLVKDMDNGEILESRYLDAGKNQFVLTKGRNYSVLLQPAHASRKFYSKEFHLKEIDRAKLISDPIEIVLPQVGEELIVEGVKFNVKPPYINKISQDVIKSLSMYLRGNQDKKATIAVTMTNYMEDSVKSEELTELRVDSVQVERIAYEEYPVAIDSTQSADSLYMSMMKDSMEVVEVVTYEWEYTSTYHNDRTWLEAEDLRAELLQLGVKEEQLFIVGKVEDPAEGVSERFIRIKFN